MGSEMCIRDSVCVGDLGYMSETTEARADSSLGADVACRLTRSTPNASKSGVLVKVSRHKVL